jgi:serine phosphatase RsbU (regulator of sigma subunit)
MINGIGCCTRPFASVSPSGDGWLAVRVGETQRVMLADGIGHGSHAYQIVDLLKQQLHWICTRSTKLMRLDKSLEALHKLLCQETMDCQAAVALVDLDLQTFQLQGISIGNIQTHFLSSGAHGSFPMINGMVGGRFPRHVKANVYSIDSDSVLALFTDGIHPGGASQYLQRLSSLQSLSRLNPQMEAESIVSRFGSSSDDASGVFVAVSQLQP